jgi:hypothetical protein
MNGLDGHLSPNGGIQTEVYLAHGALSEALLKFESTQPS